MNEALKVIHSRRSIRSYKKEQITDVELQQILDAAIYAPNAINQQKWHFTVVQNQEILDRMVEGIKVGILNSGHQFLAQQANNPEYHTFYKAPSVIIISGDEKGHAIDFDCGAAAENIALAAESLNIGSCIIASSAFLFASEQGEAFRKELGIPEGYKHICAVALGYKAGEAPTAPPRKKDVINYIK